MTERAVVDRIVDGEHAVLLVGDAEAERIVLVEELPPEVAEGDWLRVRYCGDRLIEAVRDPETTAAMRRQLAAKRDRLRRRGSRARREQ